MLGVLEDMRRVVEMAENIVSSERTWNGLTASSSNAHSNAH
jgi:hypothetical protein